MMIEVLKSKLHCVRVTEANLNYMGSITIDEDLMALLNEESDFSAFSENGDSYGSDGIQSVSEEEFENMLVAENGKSNEASNGKKDKSEKENGFLAKMGKFFFGEDEEEEEEY